jgi:LmbE family N-acetylglucosaminyl deacetylase
MTQPGRNKIITLACSLTLLAAPVIGIARAQNAGETKPRPDGYLANNRKADARFKADILLVVAHPDDEVMATAYLAREIYDHQKRVAVVFQTAGDGGNNTAGAEMAAALGDLRQIEARRAVGSLGITNVWFLGGHDTPSQNVLASLERCPHGHCLDELVRIIRITQPSVILTWLPNFTTGENHADHQASGVLATEAFDLAGDPTIFAEQISPATDPDTNANLTEGLRPWQSQKLYYFSNATHDFSTGRGPEYSSLDVSPSRRASYGILAAEGFTNHLTQGGAATAGKIANHTLTQSSDEISHITTEPVRLILGKSLVPSGLKDDVFAGVVADGIAYQRAAGFAAVANAEPRLEIGDPWSFYQKLWQAHGLDHLAGLIPIEISVHVGRVLAVPLVIENPLDTVIDVNISLKAPAGWQVTPVTVTSVGPHSKYYLRVQATAPSNQLSGWQEFSISGQAGDRLIGTVALRAELSSGWVAPQ